MSTFQYSTLDTTIRRALLGDDAENKKLYVRAFVHARRWYESEYIGAAEQAYGHRTVQIQVEADRTAALPDDYVEWSMVGLRRSEQVHNLLHNPALVAVPERAIVPATTAPVALNRSESPEGVYEYRYTNWLENQGLDDYLIGYGYPSLRPGEFTVQRAERQLLVSSSISPGTVLYLHYLSNDAPCGTSTLIHPLAEAWCEFYIKSFLLEKTNPTLASKYDARADRARLDYMQKRSSFQLEDIYAASRNALMLRP